MKDRMTCRSDFGDYGFTKAHDIEKIANKLGKYEDLGYSPEELELILFRSRVLVLSACELQESLNV